MTYDEQKTNVGDDDPEGWQAARDAEADERAEHPERYFEPFTERTSPLTGLAYARCQSIDRFEQAQCNKPVYADVLCYRHYQEARYKQ